MSDVHENDCMSRGSSDYLGFSKDIRVHETFRVS